MERQGPESTATVELAARLLRSHYPYSTTTERPILFPGRLPDGLPPDIPVPEGLTVVGGMRLSNPRRGPVTEVVLDAETSADSVRESYHNALTAAGWRKEDRPTPYSGGFTHGPHGFLAAFRRAASRLSRRRMAGAAFGDFEALLFRNTRDQELVVSAEEWRGKPTDVRLLFMASRASRLRGIEEAHMILPLLTPPPNTRGTGRSERAGVLAPPFDARRSSGSHGASGWEPDGAYSSVALETELDLASLTDHYAAQLEATGWSRSGEGLDGPQAWNTWTLSDSEDRPWAAVFTALHIPETPRRYLLHLRADRRPLNG